jgi:transcriptional regulator with XRE-family HTH domain
MDKSTAAKTPPWRGAREAKGLGLREVARAAGIDASHLSRVEQGKGSLSLEALARLAAVLELRELSKPLAYYRPAKGGEAIQRNARAVKKPGRKT